MKKGWWWWALEFLADQRWHFYVQAEKPTTILLRCEAGSDYFVSLAGEKEASLQISPEDHPRHMMKHFCLDRRGLYQDDSAPSTPPPSTGWHSHSQHLVTPLLQLSYCSTSTLTQLFPVQIILIFNVYFQNVISILAFLLYYFRMYISIF